MNKKTFIVFCVPILWFIATYTIPGFSQFWLHTTFGHVLAGIIIGIGIGALLFRLRILKP